MRQERPAILLIGLDRYALRACVQLDLDIVVLCGRQSWDNGMIEVPPEVNLLRVDEQHSVECALSALHRAGLGPGDFAGIQTTDEWSVVSAALLSTYLGCRGMDPEVALLFRDKVLQKDRVGGAGVPTARREVITDICDLAGYEWPAFDHAVLKPIAGAATAYTSVVGNLEELQRVSATYREAGIACRTFVLEEFMPGEEWVADGVMFSGELLFYSLGRYGDPCLTVVERELPVVMRRFDPQSEAWAYKRADAVVRNAITALGMVDGVFHMELFHDPETTMVSFGECAARRGAALVEEEVCFKFGVDLGASAVSCALGRRPELTLKARPEAVGMTYLPGRSGTLISSPSPAEILELPGVEFARLDRPFGSRLSGLIGDTTQKLGQVLVSAGSVDDLLARMADVRRWFDARVVITPTGLSMRQLRQWHRETWPLIDVRDQLLG